MISKTIKLYDTDAYLTEFEASVLSCEKQGNSYAVVLDKTAFFPEEGGQSCDKGTLNDIAVGSVELKGDVVVHHMPCEIAVGEKIRGKIDFAHRYRNMQFHSGEHIVSGLVYSMFGFTNVGFHLGKNDMTMDYDSELSREMICLIEDAANRAVYKNIEIIANYPEKAELSAMTYRSKLAIDENVRIVTIAGYDICACCAPHVARTGEIGIIKIVDFYRYKGGTRVHALCGADAVVDYRAKNDLGFALSALLSTKAQDSMDAIERILAENARLSAEITAVTTRYCKKVAQSIPANDGGAWVFEEAIGISGLRTIAGELSEKVRWCAVFEKSAKAGFSFVIASNVVSAKDVLSSLASLTGAKGGGNDKMVQGSVCASKEELQSVLQNIVI